MVKLSFSVYNASKDDAFFAPLYQFNAARSVRGSLNVAVYSAIVTGLKLTGLAAPPQKLGTPLANCSSIAPLTLTNVWKYSAGRQAGSHAGRQADSVGG